MLVGACRTSLYKYADDDNDDDALSASAPVADQAALTSHCVSHTHCAVLHSVVQVTGVDWLVDWLMTMLLLRRLVRMIAAAG